MKYWLNSLKLRKLYCFSSNDPFIMLVLINRTMNTLCVIIKMGKLMTLNNNRLPFCHEKKKYYFYSPGRSNHGGETICNIGMTRSRKFDKSLVSHKLWLTCNKKYNNFSHHLRTVYGFLIPISYSNWVSFWSLHFVLCVWLFSDSLVSGGS